MSIRSMVGGRLRRALRVLLDEDLAPTKSTKPTTPLPKVCGNCRAFDLAEGQRQLRTHPTFSKVIDVLGPDQMARAGKADIDPETGEPRAEPDDETRAKLGGRAHTWDQYGLCGKHMELRNRHVEYECFEPREGAS